MKYIKLLITSAVISLGLFAVTLSGSFGLAGKVYAASIQRWKYVGECTLPDGSIGREMELWEYYDDGEPPFFVRSECRSDSYPDPGPSYYDYVNCTVDMHQSEDPYAPCYCRHSGVEGY